MKLAAFLLALIGATLSYHQRSPSIDWQQNPVVVDLERLFRPVNRYDAHEVVDEDDDHDSISVDHRTVSELQQRFRTSNSFPSLQQYHHNENVNQYYNQYPAIVPTKVITNL